MKLRADRGEFAEAIGWVTRNIGTRVTLPALSGVLIEAAEGRVTCRATDLEIAAEISIPAQIDEPGTALLPGKLLAALVARFPDAPVEVSGDPDRIELACGRATFHVRGMPAEDFPSLPTPDAAREPAVVKASAFARLVGQVARAASTDEARPVLTGVKIEATGDTLTAAATDSYRLAVRTIPWEQAVPSEALVPARALTEAAKVASEAGGEVGLVIEASQVTFLLGDRRLTTRLIEGSFPNYQQLLPDAHETTVRVERAPLVEALQRVAIVAQGKSNSPVTLTFEDGTVDLQAANAELGDAAEALPAEIAGEGLKIAFNPTFLLAGLEATGSDEIQIELRDGLKPAVLRPVPADDDAPADDFTYLLMPMRT